MRLPEDFDQYKSDGRTIEIDLNDPVINQFGEEGGKSATIRFVEWLRSYGWTVSTEYTGPMQIGGRTSEQDESVAKLELLRLDELSHSGVVY